MVVVERKVGMVLPMMLAGIDGILQVEAKAPAVTEVIASLEFKDMSKQVVHSSVAWT
jgi:hypothetical protein